MKRLLTVFVILMLASSVMPILAEGGPQPVGIRPDAPLYAKHGPHWVGAREFAFMNGNQQIQIAVWYPAQNPANLLEEITYKYDTPPLGGSIEIPGHAIDNALPDSSGGPYPLIVLSHGIGLHRFTAPMFTEHWASHGFVVVSVEHSDSNTLMWFSDYDGMIAGLSKSLFKRVEDVKSTLDFVETLTAKEGALTGMIDMERIVAAGHIVGTATALMLAGARLDVDAFAEQCKLAEVIEAQTNTNTLGVCAEAVLNDAYTLSGTKPGGHMLGPLSSDPRIDAVIFLGNNGFFLTQETLAEVKVPVLLVSGTNQPGAIAAWYASAIYKLLSNESKTAITFREASDQAFRYDCNNSLDKAFGAAMFNFCAESVWDKARVHDLTNHFTTAFLLDVLMGDKEAHKALMPEAVTFPGVEYETTLK
ncbi:MAG: hypothetical protein IT322_09230 [Anaerolineae bacterium]|nr:hypothetical protein [Anaerolineae bacterium]